MADPRDTVEAQTNAENSASNSGASSYDIVNDPKYKWTLNTVSEARKAAPKIIIKLLQQEVGQIFQLLGQVRTIAGDPYEGLYTVTEVKQLYLPFLSTQHHSNQSTWAPLNIGDAIEKIGGEVGGLVSKAGQFVQKSGAALLEPGYKVEAPRVWRDIGLETIQFSFPLYNASVPDYLAHKAFVDDMINLSLPEKKQFTFVTPPVLCEYEIPGIRRGLMAEFNFSVSTKGQSIFRDKDGFKENIPDAYELTFSLKDLLIQTRNVHPARGPITITDNLKAWTSTSSSTVAQAVESAQETVSQLLE